MFEIANDKEVEVIYEENTMGMRKNDWLEMYRHAIAEPYSFMYMNAKKPKHLRIMKRFDKYMFHKEERKNEYDSDGNEDEEDDKKLKV